MSSPTSPATPAPLPPSSSSRAPTSTHPSPSGLSSTAAGAVEPCVLVALAHQPELAATIVAQVRAQTLATWLERAAERGVERARLLREHGDVARLCLPSLSDESGSRVDAQFLRRLQAACESLHPAQQKLAAVLARVERDASALAPELVRQLAGALGRVEELANQRGILRELTGHDPLPILERGPRTGRLTSVIVVSKDALAATRECIEALRRQRESEHPIEILVVDNGSRDGSREWLAAQPDLVVLANEANEGAPRARNQALAIAKGELVAFVDNDVVVTPRWLSRLLFHLDVDARSACVGPVCDRSAHGQRIAFPHDDDALDRFAEERFATERRSCRLNTLLSSFCLVTRRSTIERIGGFDERFSPWGFEDDDFSLRALLAALVEPPAGHDAPRAAHNRVALDVFVRHRAYGNAQKSAAHQELLARNWRRFAEKWGLGTNAAHGDYAGLETLVSNAERGAGDERELAARLFVPIHSLASSTAAGATSTLRNEPGTTALAKEIPCAT